MSAFFALKIGALAAAPLLVLASLLGPMLLVVDVREGGLEGRRILVPIPLPLVWAGAALVPDQAVAAERAELERFRPLARRVVTELRDAPDGDLVSVEKQDERIWVRKEGDDLRVHVQRADAEVRVAVPLDGLEELLRRSEARELRLSDAVAVLSSASRGDLVYVRGREGVVKVKVW